MLAVATQIALPTAPPWFHDAYVQSPQTQLPSYNQKGHPAGLMRVTNDFLVSSVSLATKSGG